MELESIVPWGRSFDEYRDMFLLSDTDLNKRIVGLADGPASFNYEMTQKGASVISVDPIYQLTLSDIQNRVQETQNIILEGLEKCENKFVWTRFKNPIDLLNQRLKTMDLFLNDYKKGFSEKRYINESLPHLSFEDNSFDLALISHFLFLYSDILDLDFHKAAITEALRIASEVRIYPLLDLNSEESIHYHAIISWLLDRGSSLEIVKVPYEFQLNGDNCLIIYNSEE